MPPEVPDEFAEAYRAAYEEAMRASADVGSHKDLPTQAPTKTPTQAPKREPKPGPERPARTWSASDALAQWRGEAWFLPAVAAAVVVVLVLGAYLVGRAFGDGSESPGASTANGKVVYVGDSSTPPPGRPAVTTGKPWRGQLSAVHVLDVRATCTSRPGRDSAGDPVSYRAGNAADGDESTAWRCPGHAIGERLVLRLGSRIPIAEVGLIPGYAKTDPASHTDRYAQNNRITKVRWRIGGITVDQTVSGAKDDRSMQLLRIPRTSAARVTLEIVEVDPGSRDTTAISEVRLASAD